MSSRYENLEGVKDESSSNSDGFENFLNHVKTPQPKNKYRFSTGSLSDFVNDDSLSAGTCFSSADDDTIEHCRKENVLEKEPFRITDKPLANKGSIYPAKNGKPSSPKSEIPFSAMMSEKLIHDQKLLGIPAPKLDEEIVVNHHSEKSFQYNADNQNSSCETTPARTVDMPHEKTRYTCNRKSTPTQKPFVGKSVCTPARKIIFSSDSDGEQCPTFKDKKKISKRKQSGKHQQRSFSFTDSDKENDFGTCSEVPVLALSSDNETAAGSVQRVVTTSNHRHFPHNNVFRKKEYIESDSSKTLNFTLSESDEEVFSLRDRILRKAPTSQLAGKLKVSSLGDSCSMTPKQRPALTQYFQTERICRTKRTCAVRGCFLSSLDFIPLNKKSHFKKNKFELTTKLFKLFNTSVFEEQLPPSMVINWSKRLTKTAGLTQCRKIKKHEFDSSGNFIASQQHEASVMLSEKVIDSADRLRDTLIHELCHAAVFLLNKVNDAHGPFWMSWANKATKVHPELPPIRRCHNYAIDYKYRYQCTRCSATICRHSKSIDTSKKMCQCSGKLELLTKTRGGNPFSNFVKKNYRVTKSKLESTSTTLPSHRDVMKSLSEQFKAVTLEPVK